MTTHTGIDAIEAAERGASLELCRHADPADGHRTGLSPEEAREIAAGDPSLIYARSTLPPLMIAAHASMQPPMGYLGLVRGDSPAEIRLDMMSPESAAGWLRKWATKIETEAGK